MPEPGTQPRLPDRDGNYRSRTAVIFALSEIVGKLASFAMFAVATRYLGPEGYGTFSWAFAVGGMVASVAMFGFDMALIQLGARDLGRLSQYLTASVTIRVVIGAVGTLAVAVIPLSQPGARDVAVIMTIALNLENLNSAFRAALTVRDRQRGAAVNIVVQRVSTSALSIAVLVTGQGATAMALTYTAGTAIGTGTMLVLADRAGAMVRPSFLRVAACRAIIRRAFGPGIANTLNMQTARMDFILLARFQALSVVGFFSAGYKLVETSLFVSDSLARAALPSYLRSRSSEQLRGRVTAILVVAAAFYFPVVVVLMLRGAEVLSLLFGDEYGAGGGAILSAMSLGLIGLVATLQLATVLLSRGRNVDVAACAAAALAFKLLTAWPLIHRWGAVGAGVSFTATYSVQASLLYMRLASVGARPRFSSRLLPPIIGCICMALPLLLLPSLIAAGVLAGVVYVVVWGAVASRFDMETVARIRSAVH